MRLSANAHAAVTLARLAGATRVCFGTAFIVAPRASARPWVGAGADSAGAQLLTRSMGIRDLLLGVGLLQALNQGDHRTAARWLSYGAAAGAIDAGATLAAYPSLPPAGRAFLLFITGALVTDTLLAAQLRSNEQDGSPAAEPQAQDAFASSGWKRLPALRKPRREKWAGALPALSRSA